MDMKKYIGYKIAKAIAFDRKYVTTPAGHNAIMIHIQHLRYVLAVFPDEIDRTYEGNISEKVDYIIENNILGVL